MKGSLRKKYIVAGSAYIILCLSILFGISHLLKKDIVELWNKHRMQKMADEIYMKLENSNWEWLYDEAAEYAYENNITIEVEDEDINSLLSTKIFQSKNTKGTNNQKSTILEKYKKELQEEKELFLSKFRENNRVSFVHIKHVQGRGYIIVSKSITGLTSSIKVMEICFMISAFITLFIGILGMIYLSGKMIKPINELNRITQKIADLNFEEKTMITGDDELSNLAASVNKMSDKLKENVEGLHKDIELRENLVRNMSHELKTPIAVIMGYVENMSFIAKDRPEKLERYCQVVIDECERMSDMVEQMLEASSNRWNEKNLDKRYFDLKVLLDNVENCFYDEFSQWQGKLVVNNTINEKIYGNYNAIQRAIYNFIKNAVCHGEKNRDIILSVKQENDMICFGVYNEGKTIPKEEKDKIWNVFYKVDQVRTRNQKNFGIGLSMVMQAALAHEGNVDVINKEKGVLFIMRIKNKKNIN